MSVPLRLLGLLLTAVGLVVATTGLVLLVQPLDSGQATRSIDGDVAGDPDPDTGTAAPRSPLPVSASPDVAPSSPLPPSSPPRAAGSDAGDRDATPPALGARSPTVTTVSHPVAPRPSSEAPAPSRPQSQTPDPGPTASPPPASSSSPLDTGAASGEEDREEVQGSEDPCRHAWPWSGRRGSRGRGHGWGPPLPCDDRSVGAGARGSRPPGAR